MSEPSRTRTSLVSLAGLFGLLVLGAVITTHAHAENAFSVDAVLTTEADTVLKGGLNRGTGALSNLDLTAHWQGMNGWEAFGYVLADYGEDMSANRVGDIQVTSNIDCPDGLRLFEAYGKKTFGDKKSYLMGGLINLNGIFDVQEVGGLFLNASHGIGIDYSQAGPSIFPITALGLVGEWQAGERHSFRAGLFDGVPGDPDDPKKFVYIKLSAEEGAHLSGEYQYDYSGGYLKLGVWANTAKIERLDGSGTSRRNGGFYAQTAFTLLEETPGSDQGLKGWVRAGVANDKLMTIDHYAGGGLVYTGALKRHDTDQMGIAVAVAHFGTPYQASQSAILKKEITYEVSYRWDFKDGLSIQPDLQYIEHPYGRSDVGNATVFNLRIKTGLSAFR